MFTAHFMMLMVDFTIDMAMVVDIVIYIIINYLYYNLPNFCKTNTLFGNIVGFIFSFM